MKIIPFWVKRILVALGLIALYITWTHSTEIMNLAVISFFALLISFFFTSKDPLASITPKKIFYAFLYAGYLLVAIVRSNLDVAFRVVQKNIPLNPGIVKVRTQLKSNAARMILANSITLTPGTLSVDVKDDFFYIHWIDVTTKDIDEASRQIVSGFERYLEVIFE